MMKRFVLLILVVCAFAPAQAQTKVTTETKTTITTSKTTVAVEVEKRAVAQRKVALVVQNHAHGAVVPMMALTDARLRCS